MNQIPAQSIQPTVSLPCPNCSDGILLTTPFSCPACGHEPDDLTNWPDPEDPHPFVPFFRLSGGSW